MTPPAGPTTTGATGATTTGATTTLRRQPPQGPRCQPAPQPPAASAGDDRAKPAVKARAARIAIFMSTSPGPVFLRLDRALEPERHGARRGASHRPISCYTVTHRRGKISRAAGGE